MIISRTNQLEDATGHNERLEALYKIEKKDNFDYIKRIDILQSEVAKLKTVISESQNLENMLDQEKLGLKIYKENVDQIIKDMGDEKYHLKSKLDKAETENEKLKSQIQFLINDKEEFEKKNQNLTEIILKTAEEVNRK